MSVKIYTKTGDDGTTGLFGGERVPKDHLRIEAYGTVDELNSMIGLVRTALASDSRLDRPLLDIQQMLFVLGADLATPNNQKVTFKIPRITSEDGVTLENLIDSFEQDLPELKRFILPGGSEASARLHLARTVARRAERILVSLSREEAIGPDDIIFVNRLSDLLFVLARTANAEAGVADVEWQS
jgi:cob(I)alamin adenosyltransferase